MSDILPLVPCIYLFLIFLHAHTYHSGIGTNNFPTPFTAAPRYCLTQQNYSLGAITQSPSGAPIINPYANNDDTRTVLQPCQAVSSAASVSAGLTASFLMTKAGPGTTSTTATTTTSTTATTGSNAVLGTYPLIPLATAQNVRGVSLALSSPANTYQASVMGALSFTKVAIDPTTIRLTNMYHLFD